MIFIQKSKTIPPKLKSKGKAETNKILKAYDKNPKDFETGKQPEIKTEIYRLAKEKLICDQKGKCCFCESKFTANGYGDVEHFRPKKGYKIKNKDKKLTRPGYYWLIYDWNNLLFSCQICNQKYKKNNFPLADENTRAKNHHQDIQQEKTLLIHPCEENPENHITFIKEDVKAKDEKGRISIDVFGLDRVELIEQRRKYLRLINSIKSLLENHEILIKNFNIVKKEKLEKIRKNVLEAQKIIQEVYSNESKFTGMIRANFPNKK